MKMIKGITVLLYEKIQTGEDDFKRPLYEEEPVQVKNVLVVPASNPEVISSLDLTGRKAVYTLAIPKGDKHVWTDRKVEFFGETWRTIGIPTEGIEENIPLQWNKKVMVERYE